MRLVFSRRDTIESQLIEVSDVLMGHFRYEISESTHINYEAGEYNLRCTGTYAFDYRI